MAVDNDLVTFDLPAYIYFYATRMHPITSQQPQDASGGCVAPNCCTLNLLFIIVFVKDTLTMAFVKLLVIKSLGDK